MALVPARYDVPANPAKNEEDRDFFVFYPGGKFERCIGQYDDGGGDCNPFSDGWTENGTWTQEADTVTVEARASSSNNVYNVYTFKVNAEGQIADLLHETTRFTPQTTKNMSVEWQSYDEGEKSWVKFQPKDSALLETHFQVEETSKALILTKELSFNKKHKTPYEFNFVEKRQKNQESGTVRKIRRLVGGVENYNNNKKEDKKQEGKSTKRNRDNDDDGDEAVSQPNVVATKEDKKAPFWREPGVGVVHNKKMPSHEDIKAIEKALGGKKLPGPYLELLQSTGVNGGKTNFRHVKDFKFGMVDIIEGTHSLVSTAEEAEEDEYPMDGFLYFGIPYEWGGDSRWAFDYRKCGPKGDPAVVYIHFEGFEPKQAAQSSQEFFDNLVYFNQHEKEEDV